MRSTSVNAKRSRRWPARSTPTRAPTSMRNKTTGGALMADTRALYVISVAAELAGVHPQTLRIYERKGLLEPARTSGRSRRYSDDDIELLRRIQELTADGISLAGVQRILALENELRASRQLVSQLQEKVDALQREMHD